MKKEDVILAIGSISCSTAIGFLFGAAVTSSPGKIAAASILGALPAAGISGIVIDHKATKKLSKVDRALAEKKVELNRLYRLEMKNEELIGDLKYHKAQLQGKTKELEQVGLFANVQTQQIDQLKSNIDKLKRAIASNQEEIDSLNSKLTEWARKYEEDLAEEIALEVARIKQTNIQQICHEDFNLLKEQRSLDAEYRRIILKCRDEVRLKTQGCRQAAENYNELLHKFRHQFSTESEALRKIIKLRETQIQFLQREKDGELLEPDYPKDSLDPIIKLGGAFAREVWDLSKQTIPLKLEGLKGDYNGISSIGFSYSSKHSPEAIIGFIKSQQERLTQHLGIHKITKFEKSPLSALLVVSFRVLPALTQDSIKELVGSGEEFLKWVGNQSYRFRLIAAPGFGKSPTIIVLVSHILKVGGKRANIPSGQLIPNIDLTLSYPGIDGSEKDINYPLEPFVKYRTWEDAHTSFAEFHDEWKYREKHREYRQSSFSLWVWDEFDNSLTSASNSRELGASFKECLKQAHHTNMGFIIAGQSVNTKALPGFTNNDRNTLFTEIVCGIPVIREFLDMYGKKLGSKKVATILANLDNIEEWTNSKNKAITDTAREYRVVLAVDEKSPKLFFLPNLDNYDLDKQTVSNSVKNRGAFLSTEGTDAVGQDNQPIAEAKSEEKLQPPQSQTPFTAYVSPTPIVQNNGKPHCPGCGSNKVGKKSKDRFVCKNLDCKRKTFVKSKAVWK